MPRYVADALHFPGWNVATPAIDRITMRAGVSSGGFQDYDLRLKVKPASLATEVAVATGGGTLTQTTTGLSWQVSGSPSAVSFATMGYTAGAWNWIRITSNATDGLRWWSSSDGESWSVEATDTHQGTASTPLYWYIGGFYTADDGWEGDVAWAELHLGGQTRCLFNPQMWRETQFGPQNYIVNDATGLQITNGVWTCRTGGSNNFTAWQPVNGGRVQVLQAPNVGGGFSWFVADDYITESDWSPQLAKWWADSDADGWWGPNDITDMYCTAARITDAEVLFTLHISWGSLPPSLTPSGVDSDFVIVPRGQRMTSTPTWQAVPEDAYVGSMGQQAVTEGAPAYYTTTRQGIRRNDSTFLLSAPGFSSMTDTSHLTVVPSGGITATPFSNSGSLYGWDVALPRGGPGSGTIKVTMTPDAVLAPYDWLQYELTTFQTTRNLVRNFPRLVYAAVGLNRTDPIPVVDTDFIGHRILR